MSAIQTSNAAALHQIIANAADTIATAKAALAALGEDVSAIETKTTKKVTKKAAAAAKPRAKGVGTAWAAFTAKMKAEKSGEFDAWLAERIAAAEAGTLLYTADQDSVKLGRAVAGTPMPVNVAKVGAHLSWLSAYKKSHEAEWKAFESEWKAAHPKVAATDDSSDAESEVSVAASAGGAAAAAPKKRVTTPEQAAARKAKAAAKKVATAAAAAAEEVAAAAADAPAALPAAVAAPAAVPVAAPAAVPVAAPAAVPVAAPAAAAAPVADESEGPEFRKFKLDGVTYMRLANVNADGEVEWYSGHLWSCVKGAKGDFFGCLLDDGSIDTDAEEPETE